MGVGAWVGVGVGAWVGEGVGACVGVGVGACVGVGVGACVGVGVGALVGVGVGAGVGANTVTVVEARLRGFFEPPAVPRAATVCAPAAADDGTVTTTEKVPVALAP